MVCTGCCASLDNIITYLFKKLTKKHKSSVTSSQRAQGDDQSFLRILELYPDILQQVRSDVRLEAILDTVLT